MGRVLQLCSFGGKKWEILNNVILTNTSLLEDAFLESTSKYHPCVINRRIQYAFLV